MEKTVKLTIRLSPEDMALLKSHTARTRLSQSAYLRKLIRGYVPKAYPPEAFYDLMLMKYRIDTESQLQTLKAALENEMEILTDQRKELYRQKRKTPENEEISLKIVSINQSIKSYRSELRICDRIEADIPIVRQTLHAQVAEPPEKVKQLRHRQPRTYHR